MKIFCIDVTQRIGIFPCTFQINDVIEIQRRNVMSCFDMMKSASTNSNTVPIGLLPSQQQFLVSAPPVALLSAPEEERAKKDQHFTREVQGIKSSRGDPET